MKRSVMAAVCIILLIVSVLFSMVYAAGNADHNCADHDCEICRSIRFCMDRRGKDVLEIVSATVFVLMAICLAEGCLVASVARSDKREPLYKVRFNH